ncbi:MAG TPA: CHASE2 domain-containing protein [Cyclobacteriaceae bacterium]|nr:CHASE2 domain-containing protein [Cyclobacteriaceae bacterium]
MKRFWIDCTLATAFVFVTLGGIVEITDLKIFSAFDPLGEALGDVEMTDIAFSQLREDPELDLNVVMVNVSKLSRREIAQQINIISQYNPKIIGVDVFFNCPNNLRDTINCPALKDVMGNYMLAKAIEDAGNVVLVTKVLQSDSLFSEGIVDEYDSLRRSDIEIRGNALEGFANLETDAETQEAFKTCRSFVPRISVQNDTVLAFSVKIAMLYDSVKTKRFLARNNYSETINYRGNILDLHNASSFSGRYFALDWYQALDPEYVLPELIKDKIVIMGYMGDDFEDTSWDDKFFTPLNKQYAGKTNPDMYGPVVHANIVSMILNEDYIDELPDWLEWVIAIILCFINVALFWIIYERSPDWFDGVSVLLQLVQIILLSFLMIYFFNWYSFKLDLTITLGALAVVGTCFELYQSAILKIFEWARNRLTKRRQRVLTSK